LRHRRHPLSSSRPAPNLIEQIRNERDGANIVRDQSHSGDVMYIGINRKMKFPPAAA